MFERLAAALVSIAAAILPGCDAIYLNEMKPGITTAAEARTRMGEPNAEYANADGSVTWEYNRQPNGVHTHMLTFGPDKMLLRIEQVLTPENYAKIVNGMDHDQVQRILGKPGSVVTYKLKNEEVWDWRVEGTGALEEWHFYVQFDATTGKVVGAFKFQTQRG